MTGDPSAPRRSALWHAGPLAEIFERLHASPGGLTSEDARRRLEQYGPNALKAAKPISPWAIFLAQFKSLVVWTLIGACVVSGLLGDAIDAFAILAIVILNAGVGFYQEYSAEKSIAALQKMTAPRAKVWRDGALTTVAAADVVPGDALQLEAGDLIAADARLFDASSLACVEASLTGEPEAVAKSASGLESADVPLAERENMVFMGAAVAAGSGRAVVVATGMQTEIGAIAALVNEAGGKEGTPLQRRLEVFGRVLLQATLAIVVLLFLIGLARKTPLLELFLTSVSLAVAALPEGLPAIVTAALSIGVMRMSRRRAVVRRLASVETLGSTNVICTDKTGTLTVGQMTVRALFVAGKAYDVTGEGYGSGGEILFDGERAGEDHSAALTQTAEILVGCNNAHLECADGAWSVIGDPTEGALLSAASKAGVRHEEFERTFPRLCEIPFDSDRKRHSVVRLLPEGGRRAFVNGAPELLLSLCSHILSEDGVRPLTGADLTQLADINAAYADKGLRVLGSAFRDFDADPSAQLAADSVERDLVFVALSGLYDPPRPEAEEAVATCRAAGVRVVMITGDQPRTAKAIARQLGISGDAQALTGVELDKISDEDLGKLVTEVTVYARVSAEHKLRIVRAWQANGAVVAMTGDGVNDAPAIKGADIGVAMGRSGAEVTKQASDMILTDDNFATLVAAVEEGRGIYSNIRKALKYLLAGNAGEVLLMTVCAVIGLPAPLLPTHLLWINLVSDGFPALALAADRPDPEVMRQRPRLRSERIADRHFLGSLLLIGVPTASVSFAAYLYGLEHGTQEIARTYAFSVLVFARLLIAFGARSETRALWRMSLRSDASLLLATIIPITIQIWSHHSEVLAIFFKTALIPARDGLVLLAISTLPLIALEVGKALFRPAAAPADESPRPREEEPGPSPLPAPAPGGGRGWRWATLAVVVAASAAGYFMWPLGGGATRYVTQDIDRGPIVRTIAARGVVAPMGDVAVFAGVSGVVESVACARNETVAQGQICAKIDPGPYRLAIEREEAALAAAQAGLLADQAGLAKAKAAFERKAAQAKRDKAARKQLGKMRDAYAQAEARAERSEVLVAERQTALEAARIALGRTDILAPAAGLVAARSVEAGQMVAAGAATPLFLIATSLAVIQVDAEVPGADVAGVKPGAAATFTVDSIPDRSFDGETTQVRPSPKPAEGGLFDVVVKAANPDLALAPGMTASVRLTSDRREAVLRAPNPALRYAPDRAARARLPDGAPMVWVLRDGKPAAVAVEPGLDDGAYTEIVGGDLRPGDQAIVGEEEG